MTYPPQPGYPVQPPPFGPPPPKKRMSTLVIVLLVVGGVFAFCCVGGVVLVAIAPDPVPTAAAVTKDADKPGAVVTKSAAPAAAPTSAAPPPAAPKIGTAVRDGKFEFVVKGVKCGVTKIGSTYLNKKPQGQYCVVTLTIKNIGKESQMFDDSNQLGYGAGDVEYETDGVAGMYANPDSEAFLNEINPGNTVTAKIVFDIAKGAKLTGLELHDSVFSGGVRVAL